MFNYYLEISFDSAKLFRKLKSGSKNVGESKIKFREEKEMLRDSELGCFLNPITYFQVSNVLCSLTGEKPVNSIKYSSVPSMQNSPAVTHLQKYIDWAKECYLKIDSMNYYEDNKGETVLIREFTRTNKHRVDSHVPAMIMSWFDIETFINYKTKSTLLFDEVHKVNEFYNIDIKRDSFYNLLDNAKKIENFKVLFDWLELLKKNKLTPIFDHAVNYYISKHKMSELKVAPHEKPSKGGEKQKVQPINIEIYGYKFNDLKTVTPSGVRKENHILLKATNINGISACEVYKGSIIIPIRNEEEYNLFNNNSGTATILDGGIIRFKQLFTPHNLDLTGYTKLSEISVEREKIKQI